MNRFYLVATLLLSFALPFLHFTEVVKVIPETLVRLSETSTKLGDVAVPQQFDWSLFLVVIYAFGTAFMFFKLVKGFYNLYRLISQVESVQCLEYTLILLPETRPKAKEVGSFSFFSWLVVSHKDYEHYFDTVLQHEQQHIKQGHSWDILLIEVLKVLFWFNPVLWCYKFSIRQVHEFLADQHVEKRDSYAEFLVAYAQNTRVDLISNHFFNSSLLKDRIQMIYKKRTSNLYLYKYAVVIPVIFFTLMMTAGRKRIVEVSENLENKYSQEQITENQRGKTKQKIVKNNLSKESGDLLSKTASQVIERKTGKKRVTNPEDTIKSKKRSMYFINYKIVPVELEPLNASFPTIKLVEKSLRESLGLVHTTGFYNTNAPGAPKIERSPVKYKFWVDGDTREQLQIDSLQIVK